VPSLIYVCFDACLLSELKSNIPSEKVPANTVTLNMADKKIVSNQDQVHLNQGAQ
jgi:hypothetical protein